MRRLPHLGVLAAPAVLTAVLMAQPQEPSRADGYVGSGACESCHRVEYESWRRNLHVQMTRPIADARVTGDFSPGTTLRESGRSYAMQRQQGKYFITVTKGAKPPETFEVHYTLGARRFQGYLTRLPDGRIYVLPVFWHTESRRWIDYEAITPLPRDTAHDLRQIWNVTCVNCHATNLKRNYDVATDRFATTWTEMGIGCEACHGPGKPHIDDRAHLNIFSMKKVPARQIFDACGYCHGNKTNFFFGFKAGDRFDDFAQPFLISEPIPANDPQGEFWPDGRASRFNRPQSLTVSGCFQKGDATCTSCHRVHGAENTHSLKVAIEEADGTHTRASDTLCTQCHAGPTHTHHAADSQGSRCINCHMSDVNWRLITRRLDHTFQPPVPETTARYGVPNACTTCHEDRSPEWAAAIMDGWYGDRARRQRATRLADTMYRAGAGDSTVLPEVATLAVDRSHGPLIRASAAEFAGQLIAGTGGAGGSGVVNALVGAANDAEPWVRIAAVRSLGAIDDPTRVVPVLTAHLIDSSRLVRVAAAEALMKRGIGRLDGAPGQALLAAQGDWAASLRSFPDSAADHIALGMLLSAQGNDDQAEQEFRLASRLDETDPRPHVQLGIIAARAGRFGVALQSFRAARALQPAYPNLDRLIEEAEKRAPKRQ